MTRKIFNSIIMVAGAVLLASTVIIMGFLYSYLEKVRGDDLKNELELLITAFEEDGISYLEKIQSEHYRITWIGTDGEVLYDTVTGTASIENHLEREEVKNAFAIGEGKSNRYSDTLFEKTMYYAKKLEDGTVLRISVSTSSVGVLVFGMLQPIMAVILITFIISGILADRASKRIVKPLNGLDLDAPLDNEIYEELSPLLNKINRKKRKIKTQLKEIQRQEAEFTQIIGCMNEGLVLIDKDGTVLRINPAANKIFSLNESCVGKNFLTVYRDHEMGLCMKEAEETGHSEIQQSRFGREYQFVVNRIESEGEVIGSVLLIFDVTERVLAERNRREFTASVSHELKTPLQGILGSVELIENSMVKPEDVSTFVGHIRKEAQRLVTLVNDVIRLSQLDERADMEKENVDLLKLAAEASESIATVAKNKKIEVQVSGSPTEICGVKKLLYDIVYNLCDNAVKYTDEGGKVTIDIVDRKNEAVLTVSDTGIGIPNEDIDRIFERFYRVDKSHSKETGGTGLGLSIVKHAVAYHHGTISVHSEVGRGTTIIIEIPK